jgi:hypothetical protein
MGSSVSTEQAPATTVTSPPRRADEQRDGYLNNDNQHLKNLIGAASQKLANYLLAQYANTYRTGQYRCQIRPPG